MAIACGGKRKLHVAVIQKIPKNDYVLWAGYFFLIQSYECLAMWINLLAAQLIIFRSPRSHRYICSAIVSSDWTDTMLLTCSVVVHCV